MAATGRRQGCARSSTRSPINAVAFTTTAILRIEGDLIAQAWDEGDYLGLMSQLGAAAG